jgi:hypothetical protein
MQHEYERQMEKFRQAQQRAKDATAALAEQALDDDERVRQHFLNGVAAVVERDAAAVGGNDAQIPTTSLWDAVLDFPALQKLSLPPRAQHLPWLPEGGNVMVFGPRGVGKTMLQLALTAALTTGTNFLKWPVQAPVGVLYIDGEMRLDDLRARMNALLPCPPKVPLCFLTLEYFYHVMNHDLVLTDEQMRNKVLKDIDSHPEIRVVILDNVSCLFTGIDEDKKRDWEPINAWLIRLRHRGLATVLVHHSGKGGQQRGTSGREDALDAVIQLSTPVGYNPQEGLHFELQFTKSRSLAGPDVAPLDVRLEDASGCLGWVWKLLERSKEEQVKELLSEGMTSAAEIAEALGVNRSYAWKLKRRIEKTTEGRK